MRIYTRACVRAAALLTLATVPAAVAVAPARAATPTLTVEFGVGAPPSVSIDTGPTPEPAAVVARVEGFVDGVDVEAWDCTVEPAAAPADGAVAVTIGDCAGSDVRATVGYTVGGTDATVAVSATGATPGSAERPARLECRNSLVNGWNVVTCEWPGAV